MNINPETLSLLLNKIDSETRSYSDQWDDDWERGCIYGRRELANELLKIIGLN